MFKINDRIINHNFPPYCIAELSANHNGSLEKELELIKQAKLAGADAVKFQTYKADTITIDCDNQYFQIKSGPWQGQTMFNLYKKAYTPWEWHQEIKETANKLGMDFFSSPFDVTAVDFLEELDVPCYKVASPEISDHILIKKIASTGKPVIVSTGMASLSDIESAVNILKSYNSPFCLLKCTSSYPAPSDQANLLTIPHLRQTFNCPSGLSDHTLGIEIPIVATALGANIIEKHFTLDRNSGSPDDGFSLEPHEFKQMVESVKTTWKTLGKINYGGVDSEKNMRIFRRSLFIIKDVKAGEKISYNNVKSIRPGNGLHTKNWDQVKGKTFRGNHNKGTPLEFKFIE